MKKKSLLGILAILMVIALALTGCGQKGEQNAGATGSEGQNETVENGEASESEVATEPESPSVNIGEKPDGSDPMELRAWYYARDKAYIESVEKDANGYYHYKVGDKELLCKTNVWEFIEPREGIRGTYYVWRFEDMAESIGLYPSDYETTARQAARINQTDGRWDFALDLGINRKNIYEYNVIEMAGGVNYYNYDEMIYRLSSASLYAISLEQICFSAYEMEQLKLGRTWDEIMDSEFQSWRVLEGHAIPD